VDETCQCQSTNHGHEPGACPNAPTEVDRLCKPCHDDKAAAEGMGWFTPLSEPVRAFQRGVFQGGAFQGDSFVPIHPPFPPNPPPDYAEMIARLDALDRGMRELGLLPAGIGHNQPPGDQVLTPEDRAAISDAIAILKAEPPQPAARSLEAVHASARLQAAAHKVAVYVAAKLDVFIDAFAKSAGDELGKKATQLLYWVAICHLLSNAAEAVTSWLYALPPVP
jgi:hypothetical protein